MDLDDRKVAKRTGPWYCAIYARRMYCPALERRMHLAHIATPMRIEEEEAISLATRTGLHALQARTQTICNLFSTRKVSVIIMSLSLIKQYTNRKMVEESYEPSNVEEKSSLRSKNYWAPRRSYLLSHLQLLEQGETELHPYTLIHDILTITAIIL